MEAFFVSAGIVALAEVADKTQLLSLLLATRYRKPWPIVAAILAATLLNHGLAGALGTWLVHQLGAQVMRWVLGFSFLAMAVWVLIPDKLEEEEPRFRQLGVFGTTLALFFLAEIGDKTQIATVALAAKYNSLIPVVMGTTCGMLIADVPVVFLGEKLAEKMPGKQVHAIAALIFAVLGLAALFGWKAR
jgi:putative Ca2+/H+ antiporter (TMEM165/GDT1 family)